jgi:catechol-2,3-dioxygenase
MAEQRYDRADDDVGNLVEIGHVNVNVTDQLAATEFYVTGLGLTRDPYLMTATSNMWINVGRHQFHLPTAKRGQRLHGVTGLVFPDLDALRARLAKAKIPVTEVAGGLEIVSPWGARARAALRPGDARAGLRRTRRPSRRRGTDRRVLSRDHRSARNGEG